MLLMSILFFQEEKQLLKLCRDENADISQFAILIEQGVRLNIHDEVGHSPTNSIIVVYSECGCLSNAVSL